MIIELFGLPASGKTTLSKTWEKEGWVRVRLNSRLEIVSFFLLFCFSHPFRAFKACWFVLRFSGDARLTYLKIANLLMYNFALWQKARTISKAALDQGPFQMLLSLFEYEQPPETLAALIRIVPKSDLIVVLNTPSEVRASRLVERGTTPRAEYGSEASERLLRVAKAHFPLVLTLFEQLHVPHTVCTESPTSAEFLTRSLTYLTFARMPTEKAHGVSIAHMCSAFASLGKAVELVVPRRENSITESVFEFYGVPQNFTVKEVVSFDFLGKGLTNSLFFLLQRLLFMRAARSRGIRPGVVYTRDPEIVFALSRSHIVLYEAHRVPRGIAGALTVWLMKGAHLVVCNSQGTANALNRRGISQTIVAPNGFDPALFSTPLSSRDVLGLPEGFLALYVGSDQAWKGIDVFRAAAKENPEIYHVVVGSKTTKTAGNVIEVGVVPARVVSEYIRYADVVVVPNTEVSEESVRFTSPIKIFEYLGAGKPIIASDLPSIREILSDKTARFVPPGDAQELAHAIQELKEQPEIRTALSSAAKKLALEYTWRRRAERIVAALATTI